MFSAAARTAASRFASRSAPAAASRVVNVQPSMMAVRFASVSTLMHKDMMYDAV